MQLGKLMSLVAVLFITAGCNSDKVREVLDDTFGGVTDKTKMQVINVSGSPLDVHAAGYTASGHSPEIKAIKHRIGSLEPGQLPLQAEVRRNYGDERLVMQAFDRQNGRASEYLQIRSPLDKSLQLVAWTYEGQVRLSAFRWESSSKNSIYRIRVLSVTDGVRVTVPPLQLNLQKGVVSEWLSVNNCTGEFQINGKPLDICQATPGQSFLLIVDQQRILSLTSS